MKCTLCRSEIASLDPDNMKALGGEVCGACVRARRAANTMPADMRQLAELWPDIKAGRSKRSAATRKSRPRFDGDPRLETW